MAQRLAVGTAWAAAGCCTGSGRSTQTGRWSLAPLLSATIPRPLGGGASRPRANTWSQQKKRSVAPRSRVIQLKSACLEHADDQVAVVEVAGHDHRSREAARILGDRQGLVDARLRQQLGGCREVDAVDADKPRGQPKVGGRHRARHAPQPAQWGSTSLWSDWIGQRQSTALPKSRGCRDDARKGSRRSRGQSSPRGRRARERPSPGARSRRPRGGWVPLAEQLLGPVDAPGEADVERHHLEACRPLANDPE